MNILLLLNLINQNEHRVSNKNRFDNKLSSLHRKITTSKTKHLVVENELKKFKTFDLSYFWGKNHFEENGTQNWFIFQPIGRYLKVPSVNSN